MKPSKVLFVLSAIGAVLCFMLSSFGAEPPDYSVVTIGSYHVGVDYSSNFIIKMIVLMMLVVSAVLIVLDTNDEPAK